MRSKPTILALLLAILSLGSCHKQQQEKQAHNGKLESELNSSGEPADNIGGAAAPVFTPPLSVTFASFRYRNRDGETSTTIALPMGTARNLNEETVSVWLMQFPNSNTTYSRIGLKIDRDEQSQQQKDGPEQVWVDLLTKIDGTDLYLFTSRETGVDILRRGPLGNKTGLSALCLVGEQGDKAKTCNWVAVPVTVSDSAGGEISIPGSAGKHLAQSFLPLVTPAGLLAGVAVRDASSHWHLQEVPEIKPMFEPVLGPFQVTASPLNGGRLQVEFSGQFVKGIANDGQFLIALGQEKAARQGFDEQGRRFLVDLDNPQRSTLPTTALTTKPGGHLSKSIQTPLPADAEKAELIGQLLWVPTKGPAVPYPPFTITLKLGDTPELTVTGNKMFQAAGEDPSEMREELADKESFGKTEELPPSGKAERKLLADARIVDLKGQIIPNQTACFGNTLALAMKGQPRVQLYSLKSSELVPLPTSLKSEKLLLGGDGAHIFILEPSSGIIEKWNLTTRQLVTAGIVENSQDVLALTAIEASPENLVVLLCKDRFRFLANESLKPRTPELIIDNGRSAAAFDDFRAIVDNPNAITYATADRAAQGFAAIFRVCPSLARDNNYSALIITPAPLPGALRIESSAGSANALGPYGTSFYSAGSGALTRSGMPPAKHESLWTRNMRAASNQTSSGGCFPSPAGLNLLLDARRQERLIPKPPYEMVIYDQETTLADPIPVGPFKELAACTGQLQPQVASLSKYLFFAPEAGKIVSLSADGTKLFERKLDTASVLNKLTKNKFEIAAGGPTCIWRGQALRYQLGVGGVETPAFSLLEGPSGAKVSSEGLVSWNCPADYPANTANFRIKVGDPATGRSLTKPLDIEVQGPAPTLAIAAGGNSPKMPLPLRIVDIPHQGIIRDKLEIDRGRLNVLVTETPKREFRLEVFNAQNETWLDGAVLPSRPDVFTANPKLIYLAYGEQSAMEMRSTENLSKIKRIRLPLPLAGIGCGPDTTEGVLCIAERLDPEQIKLGQIIDWDGSRITISKSSGQHVRLAFLSPMSLKPLPLTASESELAQLTFFMPRDKNAKPVRFGFSPNGLVMTLNNYLIDFGTGKGEIRSGVHQLGNEPVFVTERGTSLYSHTLFPRFDRTNELQEGRIVYREVKRDFDRGSVIRPVPGRDLDVGFNQPKEEKIVSAVFCRRSDGAIVLSVAPLPELQSLTFGNDEYPLRVRALSIYGNKLITFGHRKRQLFIRDVGFP